MKRLSLAIIIFSILFCNFAVSSDTHPCSSDAIEQANKLIRFPFGEDDRISVIDDVTILKPLVNPVAKDQKFDVLEIWSYIYKGEYRMRFIYAQLPETCVLMEQEILEFAKL